MTKEEKCPTCGGPAINRSEYWETCWDPQTYPGSVIIAMGRLNNRLALGAAELRSQLAARDKVIAEFDFDVVPSLIDRIEVLEAVIHRGLEVSMCVDKETLFRTDSKEFEAWVDQAVAAVNTQPQAIEIPAPEVTARVEENETSLGNQGK